MNLLVTTIATLVWLLTTTIAAPIYAKEATVKAVIAVTDIPEGNVIHSSSVATKNISSTTIPKFLVSKTQAYKSKRMRDFYFSEVSDVVGRISAGGGIKKNQIIVHQMKSYAGLSGANLVH